MAQLIKTVGAAGLKILTIRHEKRYAKFASHNFFPKVVYGLTVEWKSSADEDVQNNTHTLKYKSILYEKLGSEILTAGMKNVRYPNVNFGAIVLFALEEFRRGVRGTATPSRHFLIFRKMIAKPEI